MKSNIILFLVLSLITFCNLIPEPTPSAESVNDNYIDEQEDRIPKVLVIESKSKPGAIRLYKPVNLNTVLKNSRPDSNDHIFLCVPAAYTSPTNQIDGLFIEHGKEINKVKNPRLTGFCALSDTGIFIKGFDELTASLIEQIKRSEQSLFQQSILLKNSEIVKCDLFKERKNVRRALIQFVDFFCIGESDKPLTIQEFQQSLLEIGAKDAINLDMGTWSEGWYKDAANNKVSIGENMTNTMRQTNWIVYRKN